MFPLPITNVSLKKPLAAQVPLAAAERTWALVHSQDASWTILNLVWYMPPGDMPPCFLKWHIWARLPLGANASLFPSAMPSQASLQDLVASQFSFKMSRKQVCVFVLTQPGPDLDLWPFTLGRVHVVHCHRAQTRVPWGVLILRKNSDGPGTSASWDLARCASQDSLQVMDSRDPRQTAPTRARWTGSSPGLGGLTADLSPLRGSPHPHLPSGSLLQQASVPLRDAKCPWRSGC